MTRRLLVPVLAALALAVVLPAAADAAGCKAPHNLAFQRLPGHTESPPRLAAIERPWGDAAPVDRPGPAPAGIPPARTPR